MLLLLIFFNGSLYADTHIQSGYDVLIIVPEKRSPYNIIINRIKREFTLNKKHEKFRVLSLGSGKLGANNQLLSGNKLVITLGAKSLDYYLKSGIKSPFISSFITESAFSSITRRYKKTTSFRNKLVGAISLEQPIYRIMSLLKSIQKNTKSVGVVLGPKTTNKQAILYNQLKKKLGGVLNVAKISYQDNPVKKLRAIFKKSQYVIVIPDKASFNRNLAHWVITLSYKYKVPVISYSRKYSEAGALISIYSEPEQIALQTAQMAQTYLRFSNYPTLLKPHPPSYFQLAINQSVRQAFGLELPRKKELIKRLYELEAAEKN